MFKCCWVRGGEIRALQVCYESWQISVALYTGYFEYVSRKDRVTLLRWNPAPSLFWTEVGSLSSPESAQSTDMKETWRSWVVWLSALLSSACFALPQHPCNPYGWEILLPQLLVAHTVLWLTCDLLTEPVQTYLHSRMSTCHMQSNNSLKET